MRLLHLLVAAVLSLTGFGTADTGAVRMATAPQRYRTQVFPDALPYASQVYATRPNVVTGAPVELKVTVYTATGDTEKTRPLIVWIHGGAFMVGTRGEMAAEARAWARLGYVTATIDYRLDPGNQCLQVQFNLLPNPVDYQRERLRCQRVILAARDDAADAIAWLRTNAWRYRIDPTRIVVGGASAGAVTAVHVGQTLNAPGSPAPAASRVSAVLSMSGCNYVDNSIDAADAPIASLASGKDPLVPFACTHSVVNTAESLGTAVWRNHYTEENGHAQGLYRSHQDEVDRGWRLFLVDVLDLP
ncbi:MAG: alpha/beta hydrolase [Actinomycetota bacterium]